MPDYPDNSHSARERSQNGSSPPAKKLEKVVSGETKTRKKSEVKKLASIFAPEDADSVKSYILMDVIVPGIKNAIADAVSILLFGETGRLGGRRDKGSRVSYRDYYDDRRDNRREYGRPRAAAGFEYDDLVFETRGDADMVLDQLEAAIANYGIVSVADLYDLAGITCRNYTANRYGWTDIRNAKVLRSKDGYILELPRTVQISQV